MNLLKNFLPVVFFNKEKYKMPVKIKAITGTKKITGFMVFILKTDYRFIKIILQLFTFSILALIATTIVLTVINTAPAAGLNNTPQLYNTPAARGRATTL